MTLSRTMEQRDEALRPLVLALLSQAERELKARHDAYEALREKYRPDRPRVLFVAESPPDCDPDKPLRFFYAPTLSRYDNLYRGLAEALYGTEPGFDVRKKGRVLTRMKADGYWLIDAVHCPINDLSAAERRDAIASELPFLIKRCREFAPSDGVVVCHGGVFKQVHQKLVERGIRLLHDQPIPFPLGNHRAAFVEGVRAAIGS